jgi:tetratricopeptide (TPR) repeat protein
MYSASFWLVSTLNSDADYRKRLNQVIQAMVKGSPADVAWKRAFTAKELGALERDYRASPSRSDPVSHRLDWRPATPRVSAVRPLDPAEVHVLLARIHRNLRPAIAREELDMAIELDPRRAEALALRAIFDPDAAGRRDDAERAVALDPGAPLSWEALGLALLPPADQRDRARLREVVRRLEAFRESAESQCLGAILLDAVGDRIRALKLARAAVRISPTYFYGHAVLSRIAADGQGSPEAREARERAWALAPDGVDPAALALLLGGALGRDPPR